MSPKKYEQYHKFITERLVKAREEAELTQKAVAETLIISQSELSKIENGQRQIDFIMLIALSELYNKNVSFFIPPKL
ncbi:helix-turn-helix transcriptional regulator [Niastella caeni]|uniref:Helix-turn-helix transcriptional regulator n=1 Tax=Niastella caeni TaxID=2569763 RepID=A0A4S8HZK2_9BACT|nr:helix-turn-helix transcriptional regulator [Niastella caeni]THU41177.1 helix-turn-helix transcriptional regulator [Niastella caeni]